MLTFSKCKPTNVKTHSSRPLAALASDSKEEHVFTYCPREVTDEVRKAMVQANLDADNASQNIINLFCGENDIARLYKEQCPEAYTFSLDVDRSTPATVHTEFLDFNWKTYLRHVDVFIAAPDCATVSYAANAKKGGHMHRARDMRPKTKAAMRHDLVLRHMMDWIEALLEINPRMKVVIENPVGLLRHHEQMQRFPFRTEKFNMCTYGTIWKKPSMLWLLNTKWRPRQSRCQHGKHDRKAGFLPTKQFARHPEQLVRAMINGVLREEGDAPLSEQFNVLLAYREQLYKEAEARGNDDPSVTSHVTPTVARIYEEERKRREKPTARTKETVILDETPGIHFVQSTDDRDDADVFSFVTDEGEEMNVTLGPHYGLPKDEGKKTIPPSQAAKMPRFTGPGGSDEKELLGLHEKGAFNAGPDGKGFDWSYVEERKGRILRLHFVRTEKAPTAEYPEGRAKSRIVVNGRMQSPDTYDKTTSSTVTPTAVNVAHAIAASKRWHILTLDQKQAYLNAHFPDWMPEIYVKIPDGFDLPYSGRYVQLIGCLYGAKQSGRLWNELITSVLVGNGFEQHVKDTCYFRMLITPELLLASGYALRPGTKSTYDLHRGEDAGDGKHHTYELVQNDYLLLILYVDDQRVFAPSKEIALHAVKAVRDRFEHSFPAIEDPFVGFETKVCKDGTIILHQKSAILKLAEEFAIGNRTRSSPHIEDSTTMVTASDEEHEKAKHLPYRRLLGNLIWFACTKRKDVLAAVTILSQFCNKWAERHYSALLDILTYLKTYPAFGIAWEGGGSLTLDIFVDAAYANAINGRTVGGYVALLNRGIVAASTKVYKRPLTSTNEAEIYGVAHGVQQGIYVKDIVSFAGVDLGPTPLHIDNQSALRFVEDQPRLNARNAHIETKFWMIHDVIMRNEFVPQYVSTDCNAADGFSKVLKKLLMARLHDLTGMRDADAVGEEIDA
jgi:hypothetical protein